MRVEEEPAEEHLRRSPGLDARIHGAEEPAEETTPQKPPEIDDDPEIEKMSRQVHDDIVKGMLGG
mgnify:CR=1 FL=1